MVMEGDGATLARSARWSGTNATEVSVPIADSGTPAWLRPAVAAAVVGLSVTSIATGLLEHALTPMLASHLVLLPLMLFGCCVVWGLDLIGKGLPRWVFAVVVVGLHTAVVLAGHTGLHTLFLLLMVAWVTFTGTPRDSVVALLLSVAAVGVAAAAGAAAGNPAVSVWASWLAGILLIWLMARALVGQQRLMLELRRTQADLAEHARRSAALEERQRLSRELHDSATQSMYSARMYAEAALRLLAAGKADEAAEHVREVKSLAGDALAEMRLLIYELRPPILEEQGSPPRCVPAWTRSRAAPDSLPRSELTLTMWRFACRSRSNRSFSGLHRRR